MFRGVSEIGKKYAGGSAAQTAMTPSLDALIPVKHHQVLAFKLTNIIFSIFSKLKVLSKLLN